MITETAKLREFAVRYTKAWCSQDSASVAAFYSPNGSLIINDGAVAAGRCAITQAVQSFMTLFPDLRVLMDDLLVRSDHAEYRWTLSGTNTEPGGTGNRVRISGFEVWKLGEDGLIAESRGHFDNAAYKRQIERGLEEPPRPETSAQRFARSLVSGSSSRPSISGSETILGSFPSFEQHFITGNTENFYIHDGYCPRESPQDFDDTSNEDQWQLEVYKFAREV
jgi:predicted ester cyclase